MLLCGCSPGLVFNSSQEMSTQQMLERATLVFIGVIQKQQIESRPFFRLKMPGEDPDSAKYWKVVRREVRVETVLRGIEPRSVIDIYEIYWTGAATGDWNSTQNSERALFLVRKEEGKYHVVRDWWCSIFPVTSGAHQRLPLDDSHPFWERVALMNWWIERNDATVTIRFPYFHYNDPGAALTLWRVTKLVRGLVKHPSAGVRLPACHELLLLGGWGQDECINTLSVEERKDLSDCCTNLRAAGSRPNTHDSDPGWWWDAYRDRDSRRLLTAMNNVPMRRKFCVLWAAQDPDDHDDGCPADGPPPATIVTAQGDVPLVGPWPR